MWRLKNSKNINENKCLYLTKSLLMYVFVGVTCQYIIESQQQRNNQHLSKLFKFVNQYLLLNFNNILQWKSKYIHIKIPKLYFKNLLVKHTFQCSDFFYFGLSMCKFTLVSMGARMYENIVTIILRWKLN